MKGTRKNHGINDNIEVMQTYLFLDVFRLYLCDTHDKMAHPARGALFIVIDQLYKIITLVLSLAL